MLRDMESLQSEGNAMAMVSTGKSRKPYKPCGIPDEKRCKRVDSQKGWRCDKPRAPGTSYCHHHRDLLKLNQQRTKARKLAIKNGFPPPPPLKRTAEKPPSEKTVKKQRCIASKVSRMNLNIKGTIQGYPSVEYVAIAKRSMGRKWQTGGDGCLQKEICIPSETYELNNLRHVLSMETWRNCLSPRDRQKLQRYLPCSEGLDVVKDVLEPLLNGSNVFFGNQALMWGSSVCRGEREPRNLAVKEINLRFDKKGQVLSLRKYQSEKIVIFEELEKLYRLCNSRNGDDIGSVEAEFTKMLSAWRAAQQRKMLLEQESHNNVVDELSEQDSDDDV